MSTPNSKVLPVARVFAFLDLDQDDVRPPIGRATAARGKSNVERSQNGVYFLTTDRLTEDCEREKSTFDALPANRKDADKLECAQNRVEEVVGTNDAIEAAIWTEFSSPHDVPQLLGAEGKTSRKQHSGVRLAYAGNLAKVLQ